MMNRKTLLLLVILFGFASLPLWAGLIGWPTLITLLSRMFIYAIAALSLNFIMGYGGLTSFGHAAFFGVGGYVVGILYLHAQSGEPLFGFLPGSKELWLTLPLAMLVSGLAAALIGAISIRTSGVQFIMITLAFAQMLFFLFNGLKTYGGDDGLIIRRRNDLFGLNMRDDSIVYWLILALLCLVLLVKHKLIASRFGLVLQGIRQNERRMQAMGINLYHYKLVAFIIAGMGGGLAGALMANFARFASPDMLHWSKSGELMVMVILGGVGTLFGPVLGALALISLESVLSVYTEHWQLVLGPILVVVVLFARGGLMAPIAKLWGRL